MKEKESDFFTFYLCLLFLRVDRQAYGFVYIEIISTIAIGLTRFWLLCIRYVFLFLFFVFFFGFHPFYFPFVLYTPGRSNTGCIRLEMFLCLIGELRNDEFLITREDGMGWID
ncbi:hypothetical protein EYC80_007187 [Monilinia laxa]|uniref:Uncharacterized protein n=1 Tax=Monilinia laxa TaxID=61186 RepID=A0A5N6K0M1_MONLA|nr:hypothetical protein EYC80_007187 [Monilinia laxa]